MNSQDDEKLSDGVRSEIGLRRDKAMEFRANMQSKRMVSVPNFTEQEMENAVDNFFKEDEFTQKTWTRLFVENVLSKVSTGRDLLLFF